MNRKSFLAIFLSSVMILAGVFLPRAWGKILDASLENRIEFDSVSNIQLEFTQSHISLTEILSIAARSTQSVHIPTDLPIHSTSDVKRIAQQAIEKYVEASLIPHQIDVDTHMQSIVPHLKYEQSSARKSNIFWLLTLGSKDQNWVLDLIIDDKTGAVCSIHFDQPPTAAPGSDGYRVLYENKETSLLAFRELYLSELGDGFSSDASVCIDTSVSISSDDGFASSSISWPDSIRGECHVVFYVQDNSFYTILY